MLSASESTQSRFAVARRGYEIEQVDSYLESRESSYESRLAEAAATIAKLEGELAMAKRKEEAVTLTLVAATKTKDEMLESAKRQLDEATSAAREQADKILADARYEAFRLVNEAKEKSETALAEAEAEADTTVANARQESVAILNQIKEESQTLRSAHERDLENARARFEEENAELTQRIAKLRSVAGDLETRLQALARGALDDLMGMTGLLTSATSATRGTSATPPADVPTAADTADNEEEGPTGSPQRRSFYSRRSANLPRIGSDAGKSALAAASAMRASVREEYEDDGRVAPVPSENLAVHSASA
jgi:cell division septum initiation protein DivIVA